MNSHITKKFLRKLLSCFHLRIFPLSPQASLHSEVFHCRFPDYCVGKLNTEEKRVTLWVAFTHRNAVSQNASFQFWSEDISFFTITLNELPNITCRTQDNRVSKLFQEGKGGTLFDEVTHQKAISQNVSLHLICEDVSFFTMDPMGSQISLCRFHEKSVSKLVPED